MRSEELLDVHDFVDGLATGPGVLLIEGQTGIGKTTLWEGGVARARAQGYGVVTARVGRPEAALSFAALGDLFDGLDEAVIDQLPVPQRAALNVALLRTPAGEAAHDLRAVALATMSVLRSMAADRPMLVALDDVQWLDTASLQVMTFVLRRIDEGRIGFLMTRRTGDGGSDDDLDRAAPEGVFKRLEVGPLGSAELSSVLRQKLRRDLPRSLMTKVHEVTEGNPFFALEVAREIIRAGEPAPGSPLPLPRDTASVLRGRLESMSPGTRAALQVVAAAARPTVDLIRRALPEGSDGTSALTEAEEAGLVTVRAGRVRFLHPLFSAAVAALASAPEWRAVNRRVAEVVSDPEERARHLALSATGPDAEIATALDAAAVGARQRGAAASAAELASLAREFTPDGDEVAASGRAITAAMFSFDAGDARTAHQLLEDAIGICPPGEQRAAIMNRVCEISWDDTVCVERFAREALAEVEERSAEAATAHASLTWVWVYRGDLVRAAAHSRAAREAIAGLEVDAEVQYNVLAVSALTAFLDGEAHEVLLEDAVAQQQEADATGPTSRDPMYASALVVRGLISLWAGDLSSARRFLEDELAVYESLGRYVARDELLCYLAELECRAGEWKKAEAYADECLEIGEESGHLLGRGQNLMPRAWVSALVGDLDTARSAAGEGLRLSIANVDLLAAAANRGVLGFVELSDGDAAAALTHLRPMIDFLSGTHTTEPGLVPFVADAVEALVACGELAEAESIADDERLMGRLARHPGAGIATMRVPGLLLAARGQIDAALASLTEAVEHPAIAEQPFEHGRTLMLKGEVERRARHHANARDDLQEAQTIFAGLGAVVWAERARAAVSRVMSAGTSAQGLSPTERRLAALVVEGKTNREAADLLFVSVKTVEANLSRVYRKLGVRSRAELVRRLVSEPLDSP